MLEIRRHYLQKVPTAVKITVATPHVLQLKPTKVTVQEQRVIRQALLAQIREITKILRIPATPPIIPAKKGQVLISISTRRFNAIQHQWTLQKKPQECSPFYGKEV